MRYNNLLLILICTVTLIIEASTILEQKCQDETKCSQMFPDVGRDKNDKALFSTLVLRGYAYLSQII